VEPFRLLQGLFLRDYRLYQLGEQSLVQADGNVGGAKFTHGVHPNSTRMALLKLLALQNLSDLQVSLNSAHQPLYVFLKYEFKLSKLKIK